MCSTPYQLPEPGSVLRDTYVVRERLGEGGMGVVFLADQPALARTVAIKILHPALARDPQMARSFCDEAVAAGRVRHPGSVAIHDIGRTVDGALFIVMEHLRGRPLARLVAEQIMPVPRALAIVDQVLAAVGAAHDAGVIHADIKSDNFIVEELAGEDRVVLIDYGLARFDARGGVHGMLAGTPEYLAPELVLGAAPSVASDIYAVGTILYELLTGTTPFAGGAPNEILARHVEDVVIPASLRRTDGTIPHGLDLVVLRALDKDPTRRFADADEMRRSLKAIAPARALPSYAPAEQMAVLPETSPTRDCGVSRGRHRFAHGSDIVELQFTECRRALAAAIVQGDVPAIAAGYLRLANELVTDGHHAAAALELEEGIDLLSAGRADQTDGPFEVDQLAFALANLYEQAGRRDQARRLAAKADQRRTHPDGATR